MTDRARHPGTPISVSGMTVSDGAVALGDGARADNQVAPLPDPAWVAVLADLRRELEQLREEGGIDPVLADDGLQQSEALGEELRQPQPRRAVAVGLASALAASLDGVARLVGPAGRLVAAVRAAVGGGG